MISVSICLSWWQNHPIMWLLVVYPWEWQMDLQRNLRVHFLHQRKGKHKNLRTNMKMFEFYSNWSNNCNKLNIFNINFTTDINFIAWRFKTSVHTTNLHKIKFYLSILLLTIKVATYGIGEVVVKKHINHMHVCKMLESICTSTMGAYVMLR